MSNLRLHETYVHTEQRNFVCDICGQMFKQVSHLKSHKTRHESVEECKFKCEWCNKKFHDKTKYTVHCTAVHQNVAYSCEVCKKEFKDRRYLMKHKSVHEPGYAPPKLDCTYCGKVFNSKSGLRYHVDLYHKGKSGIECSSCGKILASKDGLRVHMKTHSGLRPHECGVCKQRFTTRNVLNSHMTIHSSVKKYKCEECGKAFHRKSGLRIHEDGVHTNKTYYECHLCQERFSAKSGMIAHAELHKRSEVKIEECTIEENDIKVEQCYDYD